MVEIRDNVNFDQNQIINIVVHKVSVDPAGIEGQFIYNDVQNVLKYHDGTNWVALGAGSISNVVGGEGLTAVNSGGVVTLDVNVDNATIEISSDILRIKDGGVVEAKLANSSVSSVKITDKNVTFAKINDIPTMTVIGRVAAGTGVSSAITIINDNDLVGASGTTLVTSGAIKAYVDGRIASIGTLIGGFAAGSSANFPGDSNTKKGDYWYVTTAGTVQGVVLQVGDVVIANQANPTPTNSAHYLIIEGNRDQATTTVLGLVMLATNTEVQAGSNNTKAITPAGLASRTATEARTGIAEIATQTETNTGTDDTRIVTPLKMVTYVSSVLGLTGYAATIGNGSSTSFVVTHGLNSTDVIVQLFLIATGDIIYTTVNTRIANSVTVSFSKPPANNEIRVNIVKVLTSGGAVPTP